jgi:AcrR family transcriptional regulator
VQLAPTAIFAFVPLHAFNPSFELDNQPRVRETIPMSLTAVKVGRDGLLAATLAVLDREGVNGLNLRAVGEEAGVSAPAVYWHFKDKPALLAAVVKQISAEFVQQVREAAERARPRDMLAAVADAFIAFVVEHPHRFQLLFRGPTRGNQVLRQPPPPPHTSFGTMIDVVRRSMKAGGLKVDDPVSVALTVSAMGQGLVVLLERNRFGDRDEFAEFARLSFRRLLNGLAVAG